MLAFIIAVTRRDKEINAMKTDLFTRKVGLASLFRCIDTTHSQFITAQQLEQFFGDQGNMFMFFYGCEGVLRFSDFVKLLAPLNTSLQDLEDCIFGEITVESFERTACILKKMADL